MSDTPAPPAPPLVSVVIPTLNSEGSIPACLKTVSCQSYPAIELVVVDGGSADATLRLVAEAGLPVTIARCADGLLAARVLGAQVSHGEFIILLDSDQLIRPDLVQRAVDMMDAELYDMLILEERVHAPRSLAQRLLALDKRLINARPVIDPLRGVMLPRVFRRWLLQAASTGIPRPVVQSVSGQDHAILFAEAWSHSQRVGILHDAVEHSEAPRIADLVRKGFRWGYTSVVLDRHATGATKYRRLVASKMRMRPGTLRPGLVRESFGSLCVLALKGVPYLAGVAWALTWGRSKYRFQRHWRRLGWR